MLQTPSRRVDFTELVRYGEAVNAFVNAITSNNLIAVQKMLIGNPELADATTNELPPIPMIVLATRHCNEGNQTTRCQIISEILSHQNSAIHNTADNEQALTEATELGNGRVFKLIEHYIEQNEHLFNPKPLAVSSCSSGTFHHAPTPSADIAGSSTVILHP